MKDKVGFANRRNLTKAALALLAVGVAIAPPAFAAPDSVKVSGPSVNVVAHIQMPGPVSRMVIVESGEKEYLYIGLESSARLSVVDVSKPRQPRTIDRAELPAGAPTADFRSIGGMLAVFGTPELGTSGVSAHEQNPQTLTILNVDDPANPQEIARFTGVTSYLRDAAREVIYIANTEGLWILKTQQKAEKGNVDYGG